MNLELLHMEIILRNIQIWSVNFLTEKKHNTNMEKVFVSQFVIFTEVYSEILQVFTC